VQIYVENGQEALDMIIQAYRLAEHPEVYIPVMVNLDGFVNTHTYEMVEVPEQVLVDAYLPPFASKNAVDFDNPRSYCMTASTDWNMEFRLQQQQATMKVAEILPGIDREFRELFGRGWGGMVEEYRMEDARVCLCALGSASGTIKEVVDELRAEGVRAGLVKIRFLRPFPTDYFKGLAGRIGAVGIVDRDISFGYEGAVGSEVRAALSLSGKGIAAVNFIAGIAGRDITRSTIRSMYARLLAAADGKDVQPVEYMDTRW